MAAAIIVGTTGKINGDILAPPSNVTLPPLNVPGSYDVNTFLTNALNQGDIARICRYVVFIASSPHWPQDMRTFADTGGLHLLCTKTAFPGKKFNSTSIRYYGPVINFPINTVLPNFELTYLCRNNFQERVFFERWMEVINPETTFDFSYKESYTTNINLYQLSQTSSQIDPQSMKMNNIVPVYQRTLTNAYPTEILEESISWDSEEIHKITVRFDWHSKVPVANTQPYNVNTGEGLILQPTASNNLQTG